MKKVFFLQICLFTGIYTYAQMNWLNPTPSGWINSKIQFVNDSTGLLMNYNGDLFISRDTGNTWKKQAYFSYTNTFALNKSTGVIPALDGNIYISTDYGETWLKSLSSPGASLVNSWASVIGEDTLFVLEYITNYSFKLFKSVNKGKSWAYVSMLNQFNVETLHFLNSTCAYVCHPNGIFKTTNGGLSWQQIYNETTSANVTCLRFYDTLRGVAYREGYGILRTYDGGVNWTLSNEVTDKINSIFYIDSLNLYAAGQYGVVYKSTNGGVNWTWVSPTVRIDPYDIYSQYYFNKDYGIVTGNIGRILKTRDGGKNWEWHSPTYTGISGLCFADSLTGYAAAYTKLYKTTDGGKNWELLNYSPNLYQGVFTYLRFTSKDTGFAASAYYPEIHYTTDGGKSWSIYNFPNAVNFNYTPSFSFYSKDSGYVTLNGDSFNGLFKTKDGGKSWIEVGSYQQFKLLYFINDQNGYGTKYDKIYRTSDGGKNWTLLGSPAPREFTGMWFKDLQNGFTIGWSGQLRKTVDGGANWTNLVLTPYESPDYNNISFYNDSIGYITSESGRYYKTTDGGNTWAMKGTLPRMINKIQYRTDSSVVFGGAYGILVSRPVAEYAIDSVKVTGESCTAQLQAKVKAFFSPVDSIWFEYGSRNFSNIVTATPFSVRDATVKVTATVSNLIADSIYHYRVRVFFKGCYYYSEEFPVVAARAAAPVIAANGNELQSSVAEGNQWYLNGVLIPGAINQTYTATVSGSYSVTAVVNGCLSLPSSPYVLSVTATPELQQLSNEVFLYPNPVRRNEVHIAVNNNRSLVLQLLTMNGIVLKEQVLQKGINTLLLEQVPPGVYFITITDRKTFTSVQKKLVRL